MQHIKTFEGFLNERKRETGLIVTGRTPIDNDKIGKWLKTSDLHGEWDPREGYWVFPEEEETYDALEIELEKEFTRAGIKARIEGMF